MRPAPRGPGVCKSPLTSSSAALAGSREQASPLSLSLADAVAAALQHGVGISECVPVHGDVVHAKDRGAFQSKDDAGCRRTDVTCLAVTAGYVRQQALARRADKQREAECVQLA